MFGLYHFELKEYLTQNFMMKKDHKLEVKGMEISLFQKNKDDYICLTDMARYKNPEETGLVIAHWLRTGYTIEFIGLWEQLHNPLFNTTEFGYIKNEEKKLKNHP
jgi:hypothetical protein